MKFRFKTQKYQVDAVNSIVDVFKGQPFINGEKYTRDLGDEKYRKGAYRQSLFDLDDDNEIKVKNNFDDEDDDIGFSNASIRITDE